MDTKPYWFNVDLPTFPSLNHDLNVDVVVVGAGLTGITAATLLKEAGAKVEIRCASALDGREAGLIMRGSLSNTEL